MSTLDPAPPATEPRAAPVPARFSRRWWSGWLPVPTLRAAGLLAVIGVASAFGPTRVAVWVPVALVVGTVLLDAVLAPSPWTVGVARVLPALVPLGETSDAELHVANPTRRRLRVALADATPPSLRASGRHVEVLVPPAGHVVHRAPMAPTRRGTFHLGVVAVRVTGPLGLATRQAERDLPGVVEVHPSYRSRDAAELRVRRARILDEGVRSVRRGSGATEFESLREYVQGDAFRHVDWAATARAGTPIVRTYRTERNQTVVVLLDTGRVVAGLVDGVPRLDHAMDAALALTTVATRAGDRVGLVAFGAEVRAWVPPRREASQLRRVSQAMHALEPELAESGYREAFGAVLARFRRRALLVLLTELSSEAVEETLVPALPLLTRDHAVIVASVRDPALESLRDATPHAARDAYEAAAAVVVLEDRRRVTARLRGAGVVVVDAPPDVLAGALVDGYLDVKGRGAL